jgi:hypothetical protein
MSLGTKSANDGDVAVQELLQTILAVRRCPGPTRPSLCVSHTYKQSISYHTQTETGFERTPSNIRTSRTVHATHLAPFPIHPLSTMNSKILPPFVVSTLASSLTCFFFSFPSFFIASAKILSLIAMYAFG